MPKTEEGAVTPGGGGSSRMRFFSMKRTASQHSFDTTSVDGSGPEDGLSVDSDGSDGFVMLTDSGNKRLALPSPQLLFTQVNSFLPWVTELLCLYGIHLCHSFFLKVMSSSPTMALSTFIGAFSLR